MGGAGNPERVQTVIVGGGQAGLSVGYHLARRGLPFVILDAGERIGDAWRNRWDSLRLFSPARYDGLTGMAFPAPGASYPTKNEMADYLEAYARRFGLRVQTGVEVDGLSKHGDRFVVTAGQRQFESENVVVAMANYQRPWVPEFAGQLDPRIVQLHAADYRNPSQLRSGGVLVVGAGNSGAEIAIEVVRSHPTWMAGAGPGHIPLRPETLAARYLLIRLVRFVGHHVLSVNTPIGRKVRPKLLHKATPLIRVKPKDLAAAGVERVPSVVGVRGGLPVLEGDRALDVANIIWCTGFHPSYSWIDLPVFDEAGDPMHERGVVASEPGLFFVGLQFLTSMTSATVTGVGRDAAYVAQAIASRASAGRAAEGPGGRGTGWIPSEASRCGKNVSS
ncbi:MAG: putative flavoprotein involved in transport [Actinomycetota bacterium]|nr:putative flavoprotein involved in transport [Actinomycetota bacterium]